MSNVIDTVNMGYFIYDDVDTRDYDVQVYFKSVDSTPKRVGSFVSIPSRNGAFFVDEGRYEDMSHSYDIIALDPEEGKNIINAIARKTGHHRLEDSFNQDEFYQAIFVSAVEVRTETDRQFLKYALTFTRKPQRFLKSGETEVAKASGSTITNPTLFDAHPLLKFNSNGNDGEINFGNQQIKILNAILGRVYLGLDVTGSRTSVLTWQDNVTFQNLGSFNTGDTILFNGGKVIFTLDYIPITVEVISQSTDLRASWVRGSKKLELSLDNLQFSVGTGTTYSYSCNIKVKASDTPLLEETKTFTVTASCSRDGILTVTWTGGDYSFGTYTYIQSGSNYIGYGDSTKNSLENVDIYIDLDIGEAYSVDSGDNAVSLNNFVNIGGELPVLAPGNTTITYDNTISNFKITPRWWKV